MGSFCSCESESVKLKEHVGVVNEKYIARALRQQVTAARGDFHAASSLQNQKPGSSRVLHFRVFSLVKSEN